MAVMLIRKLIKVRNKLVVFRLEKQPSRLLYTPLQSHEGIDLHLLLNPVCKDKEPHFNVLQRTDDVTIQSGATTAVNLQSVSRLKESHQFKLVVS